MKRVARGPSFCAAMVERAGKVPTRGIWGSEFVPEYGGLRGADDGMCDGIHGEWEPWL